MGRGRGQSVKANSVGLLALLLLRSHGKRYVVNAGLEIDHLAFLTAVDNTTAAVDLDLQATFGVAVRRYECIGGFLCQVDSVKQLIFDAIKKFCCVAGSNGVLNTIQCCIIVTG